MMMVVTIAKRKWRVLPSRNEMYEVTLLALGWRSFGSDL